MCIGDVSIDAVAYLSFRLPFVQRVLPHASKSMSAIAAKVCIDQFLFAPVCTAVFYFFKCCTEGRPRCVCVNVPCCWCATCWPIMLVLSAGWRLSGSQPLPRLTLPLLFL